MKLSTVAMGLALGILRGASMGGIATVRAVVPEYGTDFILLVASIYPGISESGSFPDIVVCALYGLADGLLFGFLIAWMYNFVLSRAAKP